MSGHLCPYCGGKLTDNNICSSCGSSGNANRQYFDPLEQAWQQGRFLRSLKYGRIIAAIILAMLIYGMIRALLDNVMA